MECVGMVRNEIKMKSQEEERFDKKQIALAIRNSTIEDELSCSLLDEVIIKCEACGLKDICNEANELVDKYVERTTRVVGNFTFD